MLKRFLSILHILHHTCIVIHVCLAIIQIAQHAQHLLHIGGVA